MPLAAASAAPDFSAAPDAQSAPAPRRLSIEEQVEELSLYSESGDAVSGGDIWHVPDSADMFGADGFTFRDFLDIINPLQHIPVVSTAYRAATGDTLDPGARLLGGALFGGIGGLAAAIVNAVVEQETGDDIGGNVLAALTGDGSGRRALRAAAQPVPVPGAAAHGRPADPAWPARPDPIRPSPSNSIAADSSAAPQHNPAPVSLLPRDVSAAPATKRADIPAAGAAPADAVPRLMMDALDKYEALGRARRGQALTEEI